MGGFFDDPLGFVLYSYPWDDDPNLRICKLQEPWSLIYDYTYGPDKWACELLDELGQEIRKHAFDINNPAPVPPVRFSRVSGHGIGKSAMVAWLVNFIMSTRPHSHGTVTATTIPQLETKTWAQIAQWTRLSKTGHWFNVNTGKGAMKMSHREFPNSWFCAAQSSQKENAISFQGQHAPIATSFYIVDEASGVPDVIFETAEGGLSDGEPMIFLFGNGNKNSGYFHSTQVGDKQARWNSKSIDSREVQITNKTLIAEQIADYGVDSDFIKVRVRGMFPAQSALQYFRTEDIDAAMGRHLRLEQYMNSPKILTLDNAWEGDDDGVIGLRQGLKFEVLRVFSKNDNDIEVANMLANLEDETHADAVFLDAGYGTGVYSYGKTNQRDWQMVWFGGKSPDPGCLNLRAYMLQQVRNWLKQGGSFPLDKKMHAEFESMQTVGRADGVLQFESKKDAKADGRPSPNKLDALGLSFAFPVVPKVKIGLHESVGGTRSADNLVHDPYANV